MNLPIQETYESSSLTDSNILNVAGKLDPALAYTDLQMADGTVFHLSTELLLSNVQKGAEMSSANFAGGEAPEVIPLSKSKLRWESARSRLERSAYKNPYRNTNKLWMNHLRSGVLMLNVLCSIALSKLFPKHVRKGRLPSIR